MAKYRITYAHSVYFNEIIEAASPAEAQTIADVLNESADYYARVQYGFADAALAMANDPKLFDNYEIVDIFAAPDWAEPTIDVIDYLAED